MGWTAEIVDDGRPALVALRGGDRRRRSDRSRLTPVTVVVPSNSVGVAARRWLAANGGIAAVQFVTTYRLAELLGAPALVAGRPPAGEHAGGRRRRAPGAARRARHVRRRRPPPRHHQRAARRPSRAAPRPGRRARPARPARLAASRRGRPHPSAVTARAGRRGGTTRPTCCARRPPTCPSSSRPSSSTSLSGCGPPSTTCSPRWPAVTDVHAIEASGRAAPRPTRRGRRRQRRRRGGPRGGAPDRRRGARRRSVRAHRRGLAGGRPVRQAARRAARRGRHRLERPTGHHAARAACGPPPARRARHRPAWPAAGRPVRRARPRPGARRRRSARAGRPLGADVACAPVSLSEADWQGRLSDHERELRATGRAGRRPRKPLRCEPSSPTCAACSAQPRSGRAWQHWAAVCDTLLDRWLGGPRRIADLPPVEHDAYAQVEAAVRRLAQLDQVDEPVTRAVFLDTLAAELDASPLRVGRIGTGVQIGPLSYALGQTLDRVLVLGAAEGQLPGRAARRPAARRRRPASDRRCARPRRRRGGAAAPTVRRRARGVRPCGRAAPTRRPAHHCRPPAVALDRRAARHRRGHHPKCAVVRRGHRRGRVPGDGRPPPHPRARPPLPRRHVDRHASAGARRRARRWHVAWRWSGPASRPCSPTYDGDLDGQAIPSPLDGAISPSRLEAWAACPHAYFMRHVLHLDVVEHPDTELRIRPTDQGMLVHDALDHFHRRVIPGELAQPGATGWTAEHLAALHDELDAAGRRMAALGRVGRPASWAAGRILLRTHLRRWLSADGRLMAERQARVVSSELAFGMGQGPDDAPAAVIEVPGGRSVRLRGKIDRIDRGDRRHVVRRRPQDRVGNRVYLAERRRPHGRRSQAPARGLRRRRAGTRPGRRARAPRCAPSTPSSPTASAAVRWFAPGVWPAIGGGDRADRRRHRRRAVLLPAGARPAPPAVGQLRVLRPGPPRHRRALRGARAQARRPAPGGAVRRARHGRAGRRHDRRGGIDD